MKIADTIDYRIFDPTGNITALVETETETALQPDISAEIMRLHPEVEQVGFVHFNTDGNAYSEAQVNLRMAGGEFCGNATMSAAALYMIRREAIEKNESEDVLVKASGVSEALRVRLTRRNEREFKAAVLMPPALSIEERVIGLTYTGMEVPGDPDMDQLPELCVPIVRMQGIDHIVIIKDSALYKLSSRRESAGAVIREICKKTGSECLGMMFLRENNTKNADGKCGGKYEMKPLVYVPGVDTVFWENSCASGTAAVGMYLAARDGQRIDINVEEPAGVMHVASDPETGETWLSGTTKMIR